MTEFYTHCGTERYFDFDDKVCDEETGKALTVKEIITVLNELNNENQVLKVTNDEMEDYFARMEEKAQQLKKDNEQLKKDNNNLIHILKNQTTIINELHSKLMHYELKEPIVLTKEDLELMGKAISYYSHGRCVE